MYLIFDTEADARQWVHWAWLETSPHKPKQADDTLYYGPAPVQHPTDGRAAIRIRDADTQEPGLLTQGEIDVLVAELPSDWTEDAV